MANYVNFVFKCVQKRTLESPMSFLFKGNRFVHIYSRNPNNPKLIRYITKIGIKCKKMVVVVYIGLLLHGDTYLPAEICASVTMFTIEKCFFDWVA